MTTVERLEASGMTEAGLACMQQTRGNQTTIIIYTCT